jgi:hypothetical protein
MSLARGGRGVMGDGTVFEPEGVVARLVTKLVTVRGERW